jgi:alpha-1,6-mannosyltransferase
MLFLAVVVAMALIYAMWTLWVPLLPTNLYTPLLDLGKITGYRWSSAILYLAMVLVLFALLACGYRAITRSSSRVRTWWIFAAGGVLCAELLFAYPATAVDIFGYIADGRLLALHQANPFIVAPNTYPSDPILAFLAYPDEPAQYGPIWVLLGGGIAALGRGDLLTEVLLYKLVAALAHLGGGALIYLIARKLTRDTARAQASAYLYVCNPLLLWEMVGNAHNDGLMMLLGLSAVWLFVAGYNLLVLAAISAGALVKVPIALIGPTLLIGVWRRSWARAIEGSLLGLALAAVVYRPFWEGPETLTALRRTDLFTASLGSVMRLALEPSLGITDSTNLARTVSLSGFVFVALLALLLAIRAESEADTLRAAYFTLLAALLLLTTWFQAWYVVWPLALGAALGDSRRHFEIALLSLGGLLQYFVFIYLWVIGLFPMQENVGVQATAYVAIVGPLAMGVAIRWASSWKRVPLEVRSKSRLSV